MGAIFSDVISLVEKAEGLKDETSPNDYGGETKYGISRREYPNLDIADLTLNRALLILEADYWNKYNIGNIRNQTVANQTFLLLINMNPINAIKIVQTAINACGGNIVKVVIDGVLGTKTFDAINMLAPSWFSDRIRVEAIRYYLDLTDREKSQIPNFRSWVRRSLL